MKNATGLPPVPAVSLSARVKTTSTLSVRVITGTRISSIMVSVTVPCTCQRAWLREQHPFRVSLTEGLLWVSWYLRKRTMQNHLSCRKNRAFRFRYTGAGYAVISVHARVPPRRPVRYAVPHRIGLRSILNKPVHILRHGRRWTFSKLCS